MIFITVSVAMNEGICPYTVSAPFRIPTRIARPNTIIRAQNIGIPAFTTRPAKNMEVIPIMEVIDISIFAIKTTQNSPKAIIEMKDACLRIFMILSVVRNLAELILQMANRRINKKRIIHS
jgi:hypothetical protein